MSTTLVIMLLLQLGSALGESLDSMPDSMATLSKVFSGSWYGKEGRVEEHWTTATGGLMLGLNRDATRAGKPFFEFMRIEQRADGIFYIAHPKGAKGTAFKLVELKAGKVVFENDHHDFPQVITYHWNSADKLCASIGTLTQREQINWCWQRGQLAPATSR